MNSVSGSVEVVAGYELLRRIGHGGMAEVYLARRVDGTTSEPVVVKRMLPHLASRPAHVELFLREARLAARLDHPHVVRVLECGEHAGSPFLVMEFIDGIDLLRLARATWRAGEPLPTEVVVRAMADVAAGLDHAHSLRDVHGNPAGLVHRDISPENLMMDRSGTTRVLDFGIARALQPGETVTETGDLKGKIPYMAPEQLEGRPVDGRTDLFALGVTFYWLLTGKRPFDGRTEVATIRRIMDTRPARPSSINAHIPPLLDDLVLQLLEKDPRDRVASAGALHGTLVEALGAGAAVRTAGAALVEQALAELPPPVEHTPAPGGDGSSGGSSGGAGERRSGDDTPTAVELRTDLRRGRGDGAEMPASRPRSNDFAATTLTRLRSAPLRSRRGRAAAAGAAAAIAIAAVCAGTMWTTRGDGADAGTSGASSPDAGAARDAPGEARSPDAQVTFRISASPPGARIFVDDVAADGNPATLRLPRDAHARHVIRVEAPDHEPTVLEAPADADLERVVALTPRAPASPAQPPAPTPAPTPSTTRARKAAACNPPYFVDANGIKTYKPECL